MNAFFICPKCGNDKEFLVFTSNFKAIRQSVELGIRTTESDILPSLRQNDTYVECKCCFQRLEYDSAVTTGKKYIQMTRRFSTVNRNHTNKMS